MIHLLERIFKLNDKDPKHPDVRLKYGVVTSGLSIAFNILLFISKLIAGLISNSISIIADALNNLTDASSAIITMVGFKLSNQEADRDHPFGHGRIEYITGVIVSFLIISVGFELIKSSIKKMIHPEEVYVNAVILLILIISIFVKLYMAFYTYRISVKIDSSAMKAAAIDSRNDVIATTIVLITAFISMFFHINLDGYIGVLVGGFIIWSGIQAAKETISPLLGEPPTREFVSSIKETVLAHEEVLGVHDLMVHNYGPGKTILSLHAEVPYDSDILSIHDTIDNIEKELSFKYNCHATIHMDPFQIDDPVTIELRNFAIGTLHAKFPRLSLHDFRTVTGPTHTNIIFDIVVPYDYNHSDDEIRDYMEEQFKEKSENYYTVIEVDKDYLSD